MAARLGAQAQPAAASGGHTEPYQRSYKNKDLACDRDFPVVDKTSVVEGSEDKHVRSVRVGGKGVGTCCDKFVGKSGVLRLLDVGVDDLLGLSRLPDVGVEDLSGSKRVRFEDGGKSMLDLTDMSIHMHIDIAADRLK